MEKGGKSGKKHQKIRKKYEIVLKSVFFVVLGDFLGGLGVFWGVFSGFSRVFTKKSGLGQQKRPDGPPYPPPPPPPPLGILCGRVKKTRLLAKNSPKTRPFLGGEFWRIFFLVGILPWEKCTHENMMEI